MPTVTGLTFATKAYSYHDSGLTYQEYDCIGFTNLVRRGCGLNNLANGTNNIKDSITPTILPIHR